MEQLLKVPPNYICLICLNLVDFSLEATERNNYFMQSVFLSQFLGFLEFPHEEPHAGGEGDNASKYVREGVRQSETAVGDDDKGAANHCHEQSGYQRDDVGFLA